MSEIGDRGRIPGSFNTGGDVQVPLRLNHFTKGLFIPPTWKQAPPCANSQYIVINLFKKRRKKTTCRDLNPGSCVCVVPCLHSVFSNTHTRVIHCLTSTAPTFGSNPCLTKDNLIDLPRRRVYSPVITLVPQNHRPTHFFSFFIVQPLSIFSGVV